MRNLPAEIVAEYTSKNVRPIFMAEMFFDSGTLRLWTGYGSIDYDGNTFFGAGNFIGISPIEETQDIEAKGVVFTLNGIASNIIALALGERSRGRSFRLYIATAQSTGYVATEDTPGRVELEDGSGYILLENTIGDFVPYRIFSGLMDVMEITDNGKTSDIRLSVENVLLLGRRSKIRRYTAEDQRKYFPDDKGLEFINQLQDKEVVW